MTQEIKIKLFSKNCLPLYKGNHIIDLFTRGVNKLKGPDKIEDKIHFSYMYMPLGVSMKLPDGLQVNIRMKEHAHIKYGLSVSNLSQLHKSYNCDDKEWSIFVVALRNVNVLESESLFYCEITPTEEATLWQRIKWFLTTDYKFTIEE